MNPIAFLMVYAASVVTITRARLTPLTLCLVIWGVLFTNYMFGPLQYNTAVPVSAGVWIVVGYAFTFCAFYLLGLHVAAQGRRLAGPHTLRAIQRIERIGAVGVLALFIGRLISALPFLTTLDLSGLRSAFLTDVNVLSQVGSILAGPFFIIIARIVFFEARLKTFESAALVLFLCVPVFSAGRQQYLQMMILFGAGLVFCASSKLNGDNTESGVRKRRRKTFFKFLAVAGASVFLAALVSILRFDAEAAQYFGTKLNMLTMYSGVTLRAEYASLLNPLPTWLADLFIEYTYYFGAQIPRFGELFGLNEFSAVGTSLISKFPIIDRNIDKLLAVYGMYPTDVREAVTVGNIASFTWATAIGGNFGALGVFGAFAAQALFGAVTGYAYAHYRSSPSSFAAFNFSVVNAVALVYDTMFSALSDTTFFTYYVVSMVMFFRCLRSR